MNARAANTSPVDGVLLLDKPSGATSNAILQRVKRLLGADKAGHVGTLDPLASGLLPICLGEATKFSGNMLAADKTYAADVLLGATSNTGDAEGEITARFAVDVTSVQVASALEKFRGDIMQTPPIYSALKRNGRPLYSYARAGESVEIAPRPVTIHSIALTDFRPPNLRLLVRCSKGTYIRVLAADIGRTLGCGGLLAGLRRVGVGSYDLSAAIALAELEALAPDQRRGCLKPVDSLVGSLPARTLDSQAAHLLITGRHVVVDGLASGFIRLYDENQRFLGVGEMLAGMLAPKRLMATNSAGTAQVGLAQATKNA